MPCLHQHQGRAQGGDAFDVTGTLTIHGVTKTVTVPAKFHGEIKTPMGVRAGFESSFTINRLDYGVTWNRAIEGGGSILGDDVNVNLRIEGVRQAAAAAKWRRGAAGCRRRRGAARCRRPRQRTRRRGVAPARAPLLEVAVDVEQHVGHSRRESGEHLDGAAAVARQEHHRIVGAHLAGTEVQGAG
jgi:hypothetical protein